MIVDERTGACFPWERLHVIHGELVGIGLKVQLLFHMQLDVLDELTSFMQNLHMRQTFAELGRPFDREHYAVVFNPQRYMNAQDKQIRRGMDKLAAYMTAL